MSRQRPRKHKGRTPASRRRQKQPRRRTAPPRSRNERVLQERIQKFTYQMRFGDDFKHAIRLYLGEEALQDNVLTLDEKDMPGFQEWYINDYVTSEGERIIDLFAREAGPRLPPPSSRYSTIGCAPTVTACSRYKRSSRALARQCKIFSMARCSRSTTSLPPTPW